MSIRQLFILDGYKRVTRVGRDCLVATLTGVPFVLTFRRALYNWEPRLRVQADVNGTTVGLYDDVATAAWMSLWDDLENLSFEMEKEEMEGVRNEVDGWLRGGDEKEED